MRILKILAFVALFNPIQFLFADKENPTQRELQIQDILLNSEETQSLLSEKFQGALLVELAKKDSPFTAVKALSLPDEEAYSSLVYMEVEEVKGTQDLLLSFTNINTYYKNNDTVIRREVIKASQKLQIKNSSEPKEVLATVETNQEPIVFTDRKWDSVDINVVTTK